MYSHVIPNNRNVCYIELKLYIIYLLPTLVLVQDNSKAWRYNPDHTCTSVIVWLINSKCQRSWSSKDLRMRSGLEMYFMLCTGSKFTCSTTRRHGIQANLIIFIHFQQSSAVHLGVPMESWSGWCQWRHVGQDWEVSQAQRRRRCDLGHQIHGETKEISTEVVFPCMTGDPGVQQKQCWCSGNCTRIVWCVWFLHRIPSTTSSSDWNTIYLKIHVTAS